MRRGVIVGTVVVVAAGLGYAWWARYAPNIHDIPPPVADSTTGRTIDAKPGAQDPTRSGGSVASRDADTTPSPGQSASDGTPSDGAPAADPDRTRDGSRDHEGHTPTKSSTLASNPSAGSSSSSRRSKTSSPTVSIPDERRLAESKAEATAQRHASAFVDRLRRSATSPLSATNADHFVPPTQTIQIDSKRVVEALSLKALKLDQSLQANTPITVVKEVSQVDLSTPEKVIAEAAGDLEKTIRILADDQVQTVSVREALKRHADSGSAISVVKVMEYLEPTTLSELLAQASTGLSEGWNHMVRVIKGPYRPEVARVADLLAGIKGVTKDSVFYVHSVRQGDTQGVWGIIHNGLIQNFARGMAIRRGEKLDTYKVHIPKDADEREADNSSSFLGRLIDDKARNSVVYNFRIGRMTRDPDYIAPGNEIVIINFSPEELVNIYKHFLTLQPHAS